MYLIGVILGSTELNILIILLFVTTNEIEYWFMPYRIRTYDQMVTGSVPIRYKFLVENKGWESGPGRNRTCPEVADNG